MTFMLIKNPIAVLIRTGWTYAGNRRHLIVLYLILFAFSEMTGLVEPYIIGRLLNCVQIAAQASFKNTDALLHEIYLYLGLLFAAKVAFWAFHGPGRLIERFVAFHIRAEYKTRMFKILTELPLQWHREHHSGDSIDKINKASASLVAFFDSTFEVSYMIFRLIGAQIILFYFMPFAGWSSLVASCFSIATIILFDKVLFDRYKSLNRFDNRIAAAVHDYVTNIISIITLRVQKRVTGEVSRRLLAPLKLFKSTNVLNETKWCITTIIIALMTTVVLASYASSCLTAHKVLMAGTFFTLLEYLRRIGDSFYNFAYLYGTTVQYSADVETAEPLFESYRKLSTDAASHKLPSDWNEIAVSDLYFTYSDERERVHHLENITVKLRRGQAIAFVGQSGSGKSTLLNLLRGMQDPDRVTVHCDSNGLSHGLQHLSSATTLLPQDPEIFADTLRFNITFGLESSDERIQHAVELARFEPVLARLPDKLETNISEKGINLSGGEKQRLALARGLFFAKDSDILLLDEPTSSVDQQNERSIYEKIIAEFPEKCIISSVHKLNLLDLFDYIYVFEDGKIVEQGTFESLVSDNGGFATMWHSTGPKVKPAETFTTQTAHA